MAGSNKILEPNSILFREGQESDGMYVVRQGQILIYLEKGGNEIALATVGAGAMIGEMALFDKKPRSASARALEKCEVTVISNSDFTKIMKQIPKWFVSLMSALSSRLRDTNSRLESLEAEYKANVNQLEELKKIINILNLLWYKIGEKDGKRWTILCDDVHKQAASVLNMPPARIEMITKSLVGQKILTLDKNSYKNDIYAISNRGTLDKVVEFIASLRSHNDTMKSLPKSFTEMLDTIHRISSESAYENLSMSIEDIINEGKSSGYETNSWKINVIMLQGLSDSVEVLKAGTDNPSLKVQKKGLKNLVTYGKIVYKLSEAFANSSKAPKAKNEDNAA